MQDSLIAEHRLVLDLIVRWHRPYSRDERLLQSGVNLISLFELEAAGWTERWVMGKGSDTRTFWTLTPWGAKSFGVALVEYGIRERPRWSKTGNEKPFVMNQRVAYQEELLDPELIPDPAPSPEFLIDETSGQPVKLFQKEGFAGFAVIVDKRLKTKTGGKKPKAKRRS